MAEREQELRNFAAGLLYGFDQTERISEEDAAATIAAWKEDGVEVPEGFTADYFCRVVNGR